MSNRPVAHDPTEFPILVVDDEVENLRVFELTYRREFTILKASSGEEALELLNTRPVAVIVSDHRMPGMSGTQLLARAREIAPETVRILLTAFGDAETLGQAINDGSIERYVAKPWDPEVMRVTLRRATEKFAADREREGLLTELFTVSDIARRISQELAPDRLNASILESLTQGLGFDGASLLVYDERARSLDVALSAPAEEGCTETLGECSIAEAAAPEFLEAILEGRPQILRVSDVLEYEPPVRAWVTEIAAEEIFIVPLHGKDTLLGALAVDNRRGSARLRRFQQTLVEGVAAQAAVAIHNARRMEDLRQSRLQVQRADRLGTLGTLAAGLAHEINNPLVSIHTFLSLVQEKRDEDDPEFWGEYLELACAEVERIRTLVATMSRLGRATGDDVAPAPVDLVHLLAGVVTLTEREARAADVTVRTLPGEAERKVLGVREQLHQVVLNMVLNAVAACDPGGEVTLRVSSEDTPAGERAVIEISDTGSGIPEEHLERIFDPFFTTKGPDQGTGLGLMISHRIVSDHGGTIDVASRPGDGSLFRVLIPFGEI